ncbi:MAG: integration host factor [Gammaproteobacteria bacterium]|nr:MAG: integration host factor [Gammaproteobacteria bacterium]
MARKKAPAKRKATVKKAAAKKAPARKTSAKRAAAKRPAAKAKKKAVAKRPAAKAEKKAAAKRPAARKAAPAKASAPSVKRKMTKTAILTEIATKTDLNRNQVAAVFDELESLIERHIRKRAAGEFTLPGLLKVRSVRRPATKRRMGRNPATGEEIVISAKPASIRVRVTALKRLKEMVG